jgi:hypothetical protein
MVIVDLLEERACALFVNDGLNKVTLLVNNPCRKSALLPPDSPPAWIHNKQKELDEPMPSFLD